MLNSFQAIHICQVNSTHLAKIGAGNVLESPGPEIDAEARVPAPDDEDAAPDPPDLIGTSINDVHNLEFFILVVSSQFWGNSSVDVICGSSLGGDGAELFLVAVADPLEVVLFRISLVPVLLARVVHPRVSVHTFVSRYLKENKYNQLKCILIISVQ